MIKPKLSNKTLHSKARKIVLNVHEFMKREAETGKVLVDFKNFNNALHKFQVLKANSNSRKLRI